MARDPRAGNELPVSVEQEREKTIELLSKHFAQDDLSIEELERRIEQAYRAVSVQALRELERDLPQLTGAPAAPRVAAPLPAVVTPERDRIVSVMAETKRRGLWRPARHLDVWCVMSDTKLDLTEAILPGGVTEIELHGLMCAVRVIVPAGVRVVVQPTAFMATVDDASYESPGARPDGPVIRITGMLVMGELKVRVRTREQIEPFT